MAPKEIAVGAVAVAAAAVGAFAIKRFQRKTVAVVGATTAVGAAVVKELARDGRFRVRAVITDPAAYQAKVPGSAQSVAANAHDAFSLNHALLGATYAVLVVDGTGLEPDQYVTAAKKLADAAKGANLEHCIWYTTEGPDALNGVPKTGLPQLEAEVAAARYARNTGLQMTVVTGSLPFSTILDHAHLTLDKRSHMVTLPLGSVPVPCIALESIGKCVATVLASPLLYATRTLNLATEKRTMREYCEILSKVTGKHFAYNEVSNDVFSMTAGNQETGTLCKVITDRNRPYCLNRGTNNAAKLNSELVTFEAWVKQSVKPSDARWAQEL